MKLDEPNRRTTLKVVAGSASFILIRPSFLHAAGASAPKFFSAQEMNLLSALTEAILPADEHSPGALAVGVPAYIDTIVSESGEDLKQSWSQGLEALSKAACRAPFAGCTPVQQIEILEKIAANEDRPVTRAEQFFVELKRATIDGYYVGDRYPPGSGISGQSNGSRFQGLPPRGTQPPRIAAELSPALCGLTQTAIMVRNDHSA
jgi:hypothetical protein